MGDDERGDERPEPTEEDDDDLVETTDDDDDFDLVGKVFIANPVLLLFELLSINSPPPSYYFF